MYVFCNFYREAKHLSFGGLLCQTKLDPHSWCSTAPQRDACMTHETNIFKAAKEAADAKEPILKRRRRDMRHDYRHCPTHPIPFLCDATLRNGLFSNDWAGVGVFK